MPGFDTYPKTERIEKELTREIAEGKHGAEGAPFMTTRALMEYKNISLKTAHRILGRLCASDLLEVQGKRYHLKKRAAKQGTMRIGLLLTRLDTPYFSNLASNLEELTREMGAELSIAVSDYDAALERKKIESFLEDGISGIIACPWGVQENEELYASLPVPLVLIGRRLKTKKTDTVLIDNRRAADAVANHLVAGGCTEFAYLGPDNLEEDERCYGFRLGLLARGFSLPDKQIFSAPSENAVPEALRAFLLRCRKEKKRAGVFCYHDLYASKVVNLCHEEKLSIPDEAGIAGFDNLPVAAAIYPPLTSVAYPVRDMVRMACEILFTRIHCHRVGGGTDRYLDSKLIPRASTVNPDPAKYCFGN